MASEADSAEGDVFKFPAIGLALTSACDFSPISRRGRAFARSGLFVDDSFCFLLERVLSRGFITVPLRYFESLNAVSDDCFA